jgi:23S rRNA pseudouridine2605 synthase
MEETTIRLNKYLANLGICARRDVEFLLQEKIVTVNGEQISEPGTRINPEKDIIKINGKGLKRPKYVYYLLNKPKGIVSTTDDEYGRKDVTSFIPTKQRIYPVGRLDKDTSGLLLLTNDGELTNILTHPKYHVAKVYRFSIIGRITPLQLNKLRKGVRLTDGMTKPARVIITKAKPSITSLEITLREGRNRQIRRMCEAVGLRLIDLERVKFGKITLEKIGKGQYRELTNAEVAMLKVETGL